MTRLVALVLILGALMPGHAEATERGDRGPEVTEVQTILASLNYTVKVDGVFGKQTERAVRAWQRSNGLTVDGIVGPVTLGSLRTATRVGNAHTVGGLNGLSFAPAGLDDCAEMRFYREQAGLPAEFDGIGWRESNCRNEDSVRTFCCYGYLQLYVSLHLRDHRLVDGYHACGVNSAADMNSDDPLEKQRSMCAAKVLYDEMGLTPWRATA